MTGFFLVVAIGVYLMVVVFLAYKKMQKNDWLKNWDLIERHLARASVAPEPEKFKFLEKAGRVIKMVPPLLETDSEGHLSDITEAPLQEARNQIIHIVLSKTIVSPINALEKASHLLAKGYFRTAREMLLYVARMSVNIQTLVEAYKLAIFANEKKGKRLLLLEKNLQRKIKILARGPTEKRSVYMLAPEGSLLKKTFAPPSPPQNVQ